MTHEMQGKVALVTGATNGIGEVAARELARMGATVVVAGRSQQRAEEAVSRIRSASGSDKVDYLLADLSLMRETRRLADEFKAKYDRLDVLLNNAGAIFSSRETTDEGLERTFALNHMSYFLLTHLLLDLLKASAPSRIVNVSSEAHRFPGNLKVDDLQSANGRYFGFFTYGRSKLMNILFTKALATRLQGTGVTANVLEPGAVNTGFNRNNRDLFSAIWNPLFRLFAVTPEQGAQTSVYLAASPEVATVSGAYFGNSKRTTPNAAARDVALAEQLWQRSEAIAAPYLQQVGV